MIHYPERLMLPSDPRALCGFWPITDCLSDDDEKVTCPDCVRMREDGYYDTCDLCGSSYARCTCARDGRR